MRDLWWQPPDRRLPAAEAVFVSKCGRKLRLVNCMWRIARLLIYTTKLFCRHGEKARKNWQISELPVRYRKLQPNTVIATEFRGLVKICRSITTSIFQDPRCYSSSEILTLSSEHRTRQTQTESSKHLMARHCNMTSSEPLLSPFYFSVFPHSWKPMRGVWWWWEIFGPPGIAQTLFLFLHCIGLFRLLTDPLRPF